MADIHSLELNFAKAQTLDACLPLCEAYLAKNRFMEAMVVCKKGIKLAPTDPRGRVMLTRVYLGQGKGPKAQKELESVMQQFPGHPPGLALQGRILMQQGQNEEAVGFFKSALQGDPTLEDARNALSQLGVAPPPVNTYPQAAQPGMPQPGMPQQAMPQPGMPQQAMPQPGMPQQAMPQPGMPQQAMPQPGMPQQAMPQQAMPQQAMPQQPGIPTQPPAGIPMGQPTGQAPPAEEPHLEHVSDFFSEDALGFEGNSSTIETAGPGRLTIVGFVPKSTGSLKRTSVLALAVFAVAGAIIAYQMYSSERIIKINRLFGKILVAMDQDKFSEYQSALELGRQIFAIDPEFNLALSAMAYAHAVIGTEHGLSDSIGKAKDFLARAEAGSSEPNEWKVVAAALIAHSEGRLKQGYDAVKAVSEKSSRPLVHLETLRFLETMDPEGPETALQMAKLKSVTVGSARVFTFMGWHYYLKEDFQKADGAFSDAMQNVQGHPQALLGQSLADLDRGIALRERQKEIDKNLKKVFGLAKDELSQPVRALAHFARSQLRNWQGNTEQANADYKAARKLDPKNGLFPYRRGWADRKLGKCKDAVRYLKAAKKIEPKNVRYIEKLADAQVCAGDLDGARRTLDDGTKLAPDNWKLMIIQGDFFRNLDKFGDAKAAYEKVDAKKHGPRPHVKAQVGLSQTYRDGRKAQNAVKHLEAYLKDPAPGVGRDVEAQSWLWFELGLAQWDARNSNGALEAMRIAIEQYRYYPPPLYYVSKYLKFRGEEAREHCKIYLALAPRGEFAGICRKKFKLE